jgi:hypothetical protein
LLDFLNLKIFKHEKLLFSPALNVSLSRNYAYCRNVGGNTKELMVKFRLFVKSEKNYWSTNKIIYSIIFSCLGILFFKEKFLQIDRNLFDTIFLLIAGLAFVSGLITKIKGFTEIEPLHGKLDGDLVFENDFIQAKDVVFTLEEIRNMQISNNDEYGKLVNTSKGNFGPALSNGTRNYIVIFLESGKTRKFYFELLNLDDFQKLREILIDYHLLGKIDFWELAHVLDEKKTSETLALTSEIERRSTTANTRL